LPRTRLLKAGESLQKVAPYQLNRKKTYREKEVKEGESKKFEISASRT
jgi:hypothetical protein